MEEPSKFDSADAVEPAAMSLFEARLDFQGATRSCQSLFGQLARISLSHLTSRLPVFDTPSGSASAWEEASGLIILRAFDRDRALLQFRYQIPPLEAGVRAVVRTCRKDAHSVFRGEMVIQIF